MDADALNAEMIIDFSPPKEKRRRSTFFEKRESIIPAPQAFDNSVPDVEEAVKLEEDKLEERKLEEHKLKIYHDKLKAEKDAWKLMYTEKKKEFVELQWKLKHVKPQKRTIEKSLSLLSDEDIEFLKAKPDIDKINKQARKFCKDVEFTLQLEMELHQRHAKLMDHIEHKADEIQGNILNHSTI